VLDFSDAPPAGAGYRPPAPVPKPTLSGVDGDLLQTLSAGFYSRTAIRLLGVDRNVVLINYPNEIRNVLAVSIDAFPKSDLMIAALEPLLGDGIFISNGTDWRRQRRILEPALAQMRVRRMNPLMSATVTDFVARLRSLGPGADVALDSALGFVALDVIFRTIFSRPVSAEESREISAAFSEYQDRAPQDALVALFGDSGAPKLPLGELSEIAAGIRSFIAGLIDERLSLSPQQTPPDDILQSVIDARDPEDGSAFTREELVNQIAVLFLAGHETSASVLTWCIFMISPWLLHRHHKYWKDPDIFDPERFSEARQRDIVPGSYIPFGLGARVCTGRTIAMIEGPLVLAELMRAFRFIPLQPETVRPSFRLTIRPKTTIRCKVEASPMDF
jgi:cytochrome P450